MNREIITKQYEAECKGDCEAKKIVDTEYETFMCKSCTTKLVEPNYKEYTSAYELCTDTDRYEMYSGKKVSFDYYEKCEEIAKKNTVIPKKYFNKCWEKSYQDGHANGLSEILNYFSDLEDIFDNR